MPPPQKKNYKAVKISIKKDKKVNERGGASGPAQKKIVHRVKGLCPYFVRLFFKFIFVHPSSLNVNTSLQFATLAFFKKVCSVYRSVLFLISIQMCQHIEFFSESKNFASFIGEFCSEFKRFVPFKGEFCFSFQYKYVIKFCYKFISLFLISLHVSQLIEFCFE